MSTTFANVLRLKKRRLGCCMQWRRKRLCIRTSHQLKRNSRSSGEKVQETGTELPTKITLFQDCLKDKMEFIIQKAVELGVYEIVRL